VKIEEKEKDREKSSNKKQKTQVEGKKRNFSIFFLLNKIKRNVSNVEFCARRRVIS
jgi:hypothetical protein